MGHNLHVDFHGGLSLTAAEVLQLLIIYVCYNVITYVCS